MAELALKYSFSASQAFTNSILKKPIQDVNKMSQGINVACQSDVTKKVSSEIWRLDQNSNNIICEKSGGFKFYVCSPHYKQLDVTTITKVKDSEESDNVVELTHIDPDLSRTVITNLSFSDEDNCVSFLKVIGYLMSKARLDDAHNRQFEYICKVFNSLDKDHNGFLTMEELDSLYMLLRIRKKEGLFKILFSEAQHESPKGMTLSEFISFYNYLYFLPDVLLIFCTYAFANGSINIHQFMRFLKLEQYEKNIKEDQVQDILKETEVNDNAMIGFELTINGFINYMFDPKINGILNPKFCDRPHQTPDRPLSDYYVKSCYVTGLNSQNLAQNYFNAIKLGYRHFELDIHSSESLNSIYVGTSKESSPKIEFAELISILNEADLNFGPLILTIRLNISSPHALTLIANTIVANFTKVQPILFDEKTTDMPTLRDLRKKVIIRSSISKAREIEKSLIGRNDVLFSNLISLNDIEFSKFESLQADFQANITNGHAEEIARDGMENMPDQENSELDLNSKQNWNQTITFQTDRFAQFSDKRNDFALEITSSYFVSVSPKNSYQICSPTLFWNFGVNSVVQPFPRNDIFAQLNDALFVYNANCGYVLKPDDLSDAVIRNQQENIANNDQELYSPQQNSLYDYQPSIGTSPYMTQAVNDSINVTISIICGRFMPSLNIKPFVYLELYGPVPMFGTTDVSEGNKIGCRINPRYNNQFEFELPKSAYRQTLISISLWDNQALSNQYNNQIIGRKVVHIANMRQGFRNVTLYNSSGECLDPTSILIHVKKTMLRDYSTMTSMVSTIEK